MSIPDPTTGYRRDSASRGVFAHLAGLLGASAEYLRARLELAGLESKEALAHYAIILGLALGSLVVLVFGYFFLCLGLVFSLAALIGGEHTWIWVTFACAFLHLGAAAAALLIARARLATPVFEATLDELRKDHEWLTSEKLS
jgi:uncharacterized membrane protein YqjE